MEPENLMCNNHFFIFTGGPGVGKTSVIKYLETRNIRCVKEAARGIIKKQLQQGGKALPWRDKNLYKNLMMELSVKDYLKTSKQDKKITLFDRGIPDTLAYAYLENLPVPDNLLSYSKNYRYNTTVFIFPPWKEIYKPDSERKQQFHEVVKTHKIMIQTYKKCGYEPVTIPKAGIEDRSEFIMHYINK